MPFAPSPALPPRGNLPPLVIADGTLEALKWVGLVLMVVDHINRYVFEGQVAVMFAAGRIVMPLFSFVLAYNLSRPGALQRDTFKRTSVRLFLFGSISTIPFIAIGGANTSGWPLNILFTLLVATLVIWLLALDRPKLMIVILPLFSFAGMLPEYWHLGIAPTVAAWYFCRVPRLFSLVVWLATLAALYFINGNFFALLVLPLLYAALKIDIRVPRSPRLFYFFYPFHLSVIWLVQVLLAGRV